VRRCLPNTRSGSGVRALHVVSASHQGSLHKLVDSLSVHRIPRVD
jgi:hypothetical protein